MGYSSLITRRQPPTSKKWSSRYLNKVSRVIVHHWAGTAGGVERLVYSSDAASANYIILNDGTLIGSVDEKYRAWTSGSAAADRPSITIEVQNETRSPEWRVSAAAQETLVNLIADIAKRYGWGSITRSRVRGHREFASTACPGPYLYPRLGSIAARAQAKLVGGKGSSSSKGEWRGSDTRYPDEKVGTGIKDLTSGWFRLLGALGYKGNTDLRMQQFLRKSGHYGGLMDADWGPMTTTALQERLRDAGYYHGLIDGDRGPMTRKAEAAYLNAHAWRVK